MKTLEIKKGQGIVIRILGASDSDWEEPGDYGWETRPMDVEITQLSQYWDRHIVDASHPISGRNWKEAIRITEVVEEGEIENIIEKGSDYYRESRSRVISEIPEMELPFEAIDYLRPDTWEDTLARAEEMAKETVQHAEADRWDEGLILSESKKYPGLETWVAAVRYLKDFYEDWGV